VIELPFVAYIVSPAPPTVVIVRFAAVTDPTSPAPWSRKRRVHVPFGETPANVLFRLVVAGGGAGTPPIPVTTVRFVLVGTEFPVPAEPAVVHQFAEAVSAKVYVFADDKAVNPKEPHAFAVVLVVPVAAKSRWFGAPPGPRSETSRSWIYVCEALKFTATVETVPVSPETVNVTSLNVVELF